MINDRGRLYNDISTSISIDIGSGSPKKSYIVALRIKDVKLNEYNEVTHTGYFEIEKITLDNVRFYMSKNSIKLLRKTTISAIVKYD